jgi:hypothetical protein
MIFILILSSKQVDHVVNNRNSVAVSGARHLFFLLALEPPEHLKLARSLLQLVNVLYFAVLVILDLTLGQIDFFVKPNKNERILETLFFFINPAMKKHFITFDQRRHVSFSGCWLMVFICQWL